MYIHTCIHRHARVCMNTYVYICIYIHMFIYYNTIVVVFIFYTLLYCNYFHYHLKHIIIVIVTSIILITLVGVTLDKIGCMTLSFEHRRWQQNTTKLIQNLLINLTIVFTWITVLWVYPVFRHTHISHCLWYIPWWQHYIYIYIPFISSWYPE